MTSEIFTDLLLSLGMLSVFLLLGMFLRAKVKVFQQTFLPANVIGGFILLALGPIGFNLIPIPEEWINIWALLPGILIVPIVTATPLGLKLTGKGGNKGSQLFKGLLPFLFIMIAVYYLQHVIGFGVGKLFENTYDLYPTFGWELPIGYTGGHGTAGLLGNMLQNANVPYWNEAQGVAITMATFGIVFGIIFGIVLINWASRKGITQVLDKPGDIPLSTRIGFEKDVDKQDSLGNETTNSSSIDTVGFHAAVIFLGCFLAYSFLNLMQWANVPVLSTISVWAYGILFMFAIWWAIQKMGIDYLVDTRVKGKITGAMTDFAVIGATASLPLDAVFSYLVPILVMAIVGLVLTIAVLYFMSKSYLKGAWFEKMIATLGMSTGVFITGLLLLRICDPDFETEALTEYSISYSLSSAIGFAFMPFFLQLLLNNGLMAGLILSAVLTVVGFAGAHISAKALN